ncbi:MAG: hypothetical protein RLZ98_3303 [Pseudomonadota bacterium]
MGRTLIIMGLLVVLAGVLWLVAEKLGLTPGRLPGDIVVERENFRFYFPITTMIIISLLGSLVLWFLNR